MDKLDNKYLSELVIKAQAGSSNAFAELFTATYQSQFAYAYKSVQDKDRAKKILKDTYGRALKEIHKLTEPEVVLAWLYRLCFQVTQELQGKSGDLIDDSMTIDGTTYYVAQLTKNLPLTEAQVLIMHYYQYYSLKEVAKMLDLNKSGIRWSLRSGKGHLHQLMRHGK